MPLEEPAPSLIESAWSDRAWVVGNAVVPALLAASGLTAYAGGDRDGAVARVVGLGYTGAFRALDAWVAAPFACLPLGTRTLRAELPGVLLLAAVAALGFILTRRTLVALSGTSRWASVVASVATASVSLSYPLQHEAVSVGSSLTGPLLVLAVLAFGRRMRAALHAAFVTLALTYDLPVGLCVSAAIAWACYGAPRPPNAGSGARRSTAWFFGAAAGLLPCALAVVRSSEVLLSSGGAPFATPFGDGPTQSLRESVALVLAEFGQGALLVALLGLAWGLRTRAGRASLTPLAIVFAVAALSFFAIRRGTPDALPPVALLALILLAGFAATLMHEGVLRVARARLPLAAASAAMVVLLEMAFPAVLLDDALAREGGHASRAVASWEDAAFAGLPGGALVLVSAPRLYGRLLATKAGGTLPGDVAVTPTFDPTGDGAADALAREPRLVPLFRNLALTGVPEELSLSTLAEARPLVVATDPTWDRNLTRHLVPLGLLAAFEPEPRGGADRKHGLEESRPWRARLLTDLGSPADARLASLTVAMLFDRAVVAVQMGEREVALAAIQDVAAFAPKDPRVQRLTLREVSAKGAVDVRDLTREGLAAP